MQTETTETVSVIISVYNRTDYIGEAVESLLKQNYPSIEIIIVDDGSDIDTRNHIKNQVSSSQLKIINKQNSGQWASLNVGIKSAKGDCIVFLDDDDLLHTQMISAAHAVLKKESADMAAVGYKFFQNKENPYNNLNNFHLPKIDNLLSRMVRKNLFPLGSTLIKKSVIEKIGYLNETNIPCMDWDLFLRMAARGIKVAVVPQCLTFIRVHGTNISKNTCAVRLGSLKVLESAKTYINKETQNAIKLNHAIAYNLLSAGWQLVLTDSRKEGRKKIFSAAQESILLVIPSLIVACFSYFPLAILQFLDNNLFKRRDAYRNQESVKGVQ